jgi:hypothetical protein
MTTAWMRIRLQFVICAVFLGFVSTSRAETVDLLLAIGVDVSRSVDPVEAAIQRDGYMNAIRNPLVIRAATSGQHGKIAIVYFEWAGQPFQRVVVPWTVIRSAADAEAFTSELAKHPPESWSRTSISAAIDYAVRLFETSPHQAARRVMDISGDGSNNHGRSVTAARDEAVAKGIVINGLPVINERPNFGAPSERNLDLYYENNVIGGPGSFMMVAESFEAFGTAILSKLIREIAEAPPETLAR